MIIPKTNPLVFGQKLTHTHTCSPWWFQFSVDMLPVCFLDDHQSAFFSLVGLQLDHSYLPSLHLRGVLRLDFQWNMSWHGQQNGLQKSGKWNRSQGSLTSLLKRWFTNSQIPLKCEFLYWQWINIRRTPTVHKKKQKESRSHVVGGFPSLEVKCCLNQLAIDETHSSPELWCHIMGL